MSVGPAGDHPNVTAARLTPQPGRVHDRAMRIADPVPRTLAIIGAGFSGTALACRLLRPGAWNGRVALIEQSGRFGPGLAYGSLSHNASLNVPACEMSLDERCPGDLVEYLRSRGIDAQHHDFVSRRLYGQYLEARLDEAARGCGDWPRLHRITGLATAIARLDVSGAWQVSIDDGRRIRADRVVLALGHSAPASLAALSTIEGTSQYIPEPWSMLPSTRPDGRVLIVGTGLTMADVACELAERPNGPRAIIAVSRHGLLARTRASHGPDSTRARIETAPPGSARTLRSVVSATRHAVREANARGRDWRDVVAGLRDDTAPLWAQLTVADRRRFLRHVRPYWDVHRHLLPPAVGETVNTLLSEGRLQVRAARIVAAEPRGRRVNVTLRARGSGNVESLEVDQVVNCTGPDGDPRHSRSPLVRGLVTDGLLTPDPTGCGVLVDARCHPVDRAGRSVQGLYYLGPWLRARDWEATAVRELRQAATAVAEALRRESRAEKTSRGASAEAPLRYVR
jgi:uncharacterized NAD(P)/FAD-binding protein YdhS